MQVNNNISFTSVIPVKVVANGQECKNVDTIRKVCNAVIKEISGPIKNNPNPTIRNATARLSTMDPDYNYFKAYTNGYLANGNGINSDHFRTIIGGQGGYIVTGPAVNDFKILGERIGRAQKECKEAGLKNSPQLEDAYFQYSKHIQTIGRNIKLRLTEIYDKQSGYRLGRPQQMEVKVTTGHVKRKGEEKVVIKSIDNIDFTDRIDFTKTS